MVVPAPADPPEPAAPPVPVDPAPPEPPVPVLPLLPVLVDAVAPAPPFPPLPVAPAPVESESPLPPQPRIDAAPTRQARRGAGDLHILQGDSNARGGVKATGVGALTSALDALLGERPNQIRNQLQGWTPPFAWLVCPGKLRPCEKRNIRPRYDSRVQEGMPEKSTKARARDAARAGKAPSTQAGW